MLLVRTRIAPSRVHGIGLFAAERISRGSVVWEFRRGFDAVLSRSDIRNLSSAARVQVENYAYLDLRTGEIILCGDDARFLNHDDDPNVVDDPADPYRCFARRDLAAGEELLCNYFEFDRTASRKLPAYAKRMRRSVGRC
jgi:uncharacterized protein